MKSTTPDRLKKCRWETPKEAAVATWSEMLAENGQKRVNQFRQRLYKVLREKKKWSDYRAAVYAFRIFEIEPPRGGGPTG